VSTGRPWLSPRCVGSMSVNTWPSICHYVSEKKFAYAKNTVFWHVTPCSLVDEN
jgi:hypothetical protein